MARDFHGAFKLINVWTYDVRQTFFCCVCIISNMCISNRIKNLHICKKIFCRKTNSFKLNGISNSFLKRLWCFMLYSLFCIHKILLKYLSNFFIREFCFFSFFSPENHRITLQRIISFSFLDPINLWKIVDLKLKIHQQDSRSLQNKNFLQIDFGFLVLLGPSELFFAFKTATAQALVVIHGWEVNLWAASVAMTF